MENLTIPERKKKKSVDGPERDIAIFNPHPYMTQSHKARFFSKHIKHGVTKITCHFFTTNTNTFVNIIGYVSIRL